MIKGLGAIAESFDKSANYIKMKNNESKLLRILVPASEIIGVYEHTEEFNGQWRTVTCLGKTTCPLCLAGKRGSFKAYVPVLDRSDNKVKIFKASKDTTKLILGLVEEYGDITARDFKVVRNGEKLDTTYQFFAKDPTEFDLTSVEIPDIEEMVTPISREAMIALMNGGNDGAPAGGNGAGTGDEDYPF